LSILKTFAVMPSVARASVRKSREHRRSLQREASENRDRKALKLFVDFPPRQHHLIQPSWKLSIAGYGLAGVGDAKEDQGRLQLVTQVTKELEDDPLFTRAAGEQVVDFVDDDNVDFQPGHGAA
jgi:hypothetical protein